MRGRKVLRMCSIFWGNILVLVYSGIYQVYSTGLWGASGIFHIAPAPKRGNAHTTLGCMLGWQAMVGHSAPPPCVVARAPRRRGLLPAWGARGGACSLPLPNVHSLWAWWGILVGYTGNIPNTGIYQEYSYPPNWDTRYIANLRCLDCC